MAPAEEATSAAGAPEARDPRHGRGPLALLIGVSLVFFVYCIYSMMVGLTMPRPAPQGRASAASSARAPPRP